jgi:H+/Cl- antiporter ClcA
MSKKVFWALMCRILAAFTVGLTAAFACLLFLFLLQRVTDVRLREPALIGLLPWFGYLTVVLFEKLGGRAKEGFALILDEVHRPQVVIPARMAPLILVSTLLSHLGGASVGREGTAVQMGASLAEPWARLWRLGGRERARLLMAGASAGFASAVGAPWAGVLFGLEVLYVGSLQWKGLLEAGVAAFTGYGLLTLIGWEHGEYPKPVFEGIWTWNLLPAMVGLGLGIGLWSRAFIWLTHRVEVYGQQFLPSARKRTLIVGFFLVFAFALEGSYRFVGLGLGDIHKAFTEPVGWSAALGKMLFTALSVGSGFKGGEFVPLIFMGSSLGNSLSPLLGVNLTLAAALGAIACFASAANTPWTGIVMAMELFGWQSGPLAFIVCFVAYGVTPAQGVYKGQRRSTRLE